MIVSTFSFAVHMLVSSSRILKPVAEVLEFVLPYRNIITKAIMGKINFNSKHLGKGDPLPPFNGKLRVYNMRYCPYAQRTVLGLLAKGLDFEVVNINLMNKPEWLTSKSPLGKVPALEVKENVIVFESLITVEYIDETYPQRPLLPKDPFKRAQDKVFLEVVSPGITSLFIKVIKAPETITDAVVENYTKSIAAYDEELKKRGSKFLYGDEPGYVDYMIWPWIERIWLMKDYHQQLEFDTSQYSRLAKYIDDMLKDPVVAAYVLPKEALVHVMSGYKNNSPDYDYLLGQ